MDPAIFSKNLLDIGVTGAILAFIIYFLLYKLWPWFTKEYWPAKQRQESKMQEAVVGIKEALIALRMLVESDQTSIAEMKVTLNQVQTTLSVQGEKIDILLEAKSGDKPA